MKILYFVSILPNFYEQPEQFEVLLHRLTLTFYTIVLNVSVCLFVCLSVCLSVCHRISETACPNFTKFPIHHSIISNS